MKTKKYKYTECGLDNIYIEGLIQKEDDGGEQVITIPYIHELHDRIAKGVIDKAGKLNGKEIKFLRVELGLTQEKLAKKLKVSTGTISQWENGTRNISAVADKTLRIDVFAMLVDKKSPAISTPIGTPVGTRKKITFKAEKSGYSRALSSAA